MNRDDKQKKKNPRILANHAKRFRETCFDWTRMTSSNQGFGAKTIIHVLLVY
jgi:hypothetical protein